MENPHVVEYTQRHWPLESPDFEILHGWKCSCGAKGQVHYSSIQVAERSALRHLASMLAGTR